ncbi:histidine kinase [candidate division KSB1 bacterium]|nr:histidine kinase [candidate division KSB1 bacterium]
MKKSRLLWWGLGLWTLWIPFYALVMYFQLGRLPFYVTLISSINYNYAFALLSLFIWRLCQWMPFDKFNKILFIGLHFALAQCISVIWIVMVYGVWYLSEGAIIFQQLNIKEIIGWQFLYGMMQYFLVAGIFYTIIYYRNLKQKELEEAELKILTRDAELKALKSQMNPHFLFNTLNSINALIPTDPGLARKMIVSLADLLRASVESHDQLLISLKEELVLVHLYLSIENIRFGEKMRYQEKIAPELLNKPFPAMLLQPLLENAVKHGIANTRDGGTIILKLEADGNYFKGSVVNEIRGTALPAANSPEHPGISLANIRQRLDLLFGNDYEWQIDHPQPHQFKIIFKLPILKI